MSGISGDQELTADGIRGFAVKAFSGFLTWSFDINLCALAVAATFLARFVALSRSGQTLFIPTIKITFFGPWAMQDTRLELPSILTRTPSSVTALALDKRNLHHRLP